MNRKNIPIGSRFGTRVVVEELPERKNGYIIYRVRCDCGNISTMNGSYLRIQNRPCRNCTAKLCVKKGEQHHFYKHGKAVRDLGKTPTYNIWVSMRARCRNPSDRSFKNYGARGIKVCEEWECFETFLMDMGNRPDKYSIERMDNDKGYFKENCKWATRKEQNNNRRDTTYFIIDGVKVTRTKIEEKMGWTRSKYRRKQESKGSEWILKCYIEKSTP